MTCSYKLLNQQEEIAQEKEVEKDVEENEIIENASEDDILVDEPPKPKKKSETAKKVKQEKKPKKERTTRSRRKPETEVELENEVFVSVLSINYKISKLCQVDELLASAEKPKMSSRRGTSIGRNHKIIPNVEYIQRNSNEEKSVTRFK